MASVKHGHSDWCVCLPCSCFAVLSSQYLCTKKYVSEPVGELLSVVIFSVSAQVLLTQENIKVHDRGRKRKVIYKSVLPCTHCDISWISVNPWREDVTPLSHHWQSQIMYSALECVQHRHPHGRPWSALPRCSSRSLYTERMLYFWAVCNGQGALTSTTVCWCSALRGRRPSGPGEEATSELIHSDSALHLHISLHATSLSDVSRAHFCSLWVCGTRCLTNAVIPLAAGWLTKTGSMFDSVCVFLWHGERQRQRTVRWIKVKA